MNRRNLLGVACGMMAMLLPAMALGQSQGPASTVPVVVSGQLPAATPGEDVKLTNIFQGSVSMGTNYDDNAINGAPPRQWDLGYFVAPRLEFAETLPRLDWGLSYAPGIQISQNINYRNQFTQDFGGHFTWLTTQHSTLSAQQDYLRSINPFQQLTNTPGPNVSPNQTVFLPNVLRTAIISNVVYAYQFTAHSSFGMGGNYDSEHYDSTPHTGPTQPLIYSRVASGHAYYSHEFTARNQFGGEYQIQVLRFPAANARTTTHAFQLFDEFKITPNTTLTLYGGPEYALTANQVILNLGFFVITIPVNTNQWTGAGGAIFTWAGRRLATTINYSRRISDGGGLVGAVELNTGSADFTWKLTRRWTLGSTLSAGDNKLLAVNSSSNELLTYSARVSLGRQLSRNVSMNMGYQRLNQTGGFTSFPIGNHDLAYVSLSYSFLKPLGR